MPERQRIYLHGLTSMQCAPPVLNTSSIVLRYPLRFYLAVVEETLEIKSGGQGLETRPHMSIL